MAKFKPKWVVCLLSRDSYSYKCNNVHKNDMGEYSNTYRFMGKPLRYLVKDKEDYNELMGLDIFEDYEAPGEIEESAKSETTKERKLREEAEAKAAIQSVEDQKGGEAMSDEDTAKADETTEETTEKSEESTEVAKEESDEAPKDDSEGSSEESDEKKEAD